MPNVTMLASGTRGDIQPLLVLAGQLARNGIPARLVAHAPFAPLAAEAGVAFAPLDGDLNDLLLPAANQGVLTVSRNPLQSLQSSLHFLRAARPVFARMIDHAWRQCQGSSALLVTLPTLWGLCIAEALGIPAQVALFQPLTPTAAFPSPFLPFTASLGPLLNRASHHVLLRLLWLPWRAELARWRRSTLGLRSPMPATALAASARVGAPWLYAISPQVLPRPADWPAAHCLTGFWLPEAQAYTPAPELAAFLEHGPAPIFIGFGSMGGPTPRELAALLQALGGRRALIAGLAGQPRLPPTVLAVGAVPHGWLFPQIAIAVHHGGAGTTAAALHAGVPQVVVPLGVDQRFWGQRVQALGVGVVACERSQLSAERLAPALALAEAARANAIHWGQRLRSEHGAAAAAGFVAEGLE